MYAGTTTLVHHNKLDRRSLGEMCAEVDGRDRFLVTSPRESGVVFEIICLLNPVRFRVAICNQ